MKPDGPLEHMVIDAADVRVSKGREELHTEYLVLDEKQFDARHHPSTMEILVCGAWHGHA